MLSNILRISHNAVHKHRKRLVEEHYQEADVYAQPDINSAIRVLAQNDRSCDMGGELTVPRRIMSMMDKKYESGLSIEEMCVLYIKDYYDTETEK